MNESSIFGPGVDELWLQRKRQSKRINYGLTTGTTLPPAIVQQLGDAEKFYINGNNEEAIRILSEVTKAAPRLAEPYKILALIYEQFYADEQLLQLYAMSAALTSKDLTLWEKVYFYGKKLNESQQTNYAINKCITLCRDRKIYYQERIGLLIRMGRIIPFRESMKYYYSKFPNDKFILLYAADQFYAHNYFKYSSQYYLKFLYAFFTTKNELFIPNNFLPGSQHLNTIFNSRNTLDLLIKNFHQIIYCFRRYTRVLFDMNEFAQILILIENLFNLYQSLYSYYLEHYRDYINPDDLNKIDEEDYNEEDDEEGEDEMEVDEDESLKRNKNSRRNRSLEHLLPEEFPADLLLLLGVVKLMLYKTEDDITAALEVLNPLVQSMQQSAQDIFPLTSSSSSSLSLGAQSMDLRDVLEKHSEIHDLYDFIPSTTHHVPDDDDEEEQQQQNSKQTTNEQTKQKAALKKQKKEEYLKIIYEKENHEKTFRNAAKENEIIHLQLLYYLIITSSLFHHLGMKVRSQKLFSFLIDILSSIDYIEVNNLSGVLCACAYELCAISDRKRSLQLIQYSLQINPYHLESINFLSYLLLQQKNQEEIILENIPLIESFLTYFLEDFEKFSRRTLNEAAKKKELLATNVEKEKEKKEKEKKPKKKGRPKKKEEEELEEEENEEIEEEEEEVEENDEVEGDEEVDDLETSLFTSPLKSAAHVGTEVSLPVDEGEGNNNITSMEGDDKNVDQIDDLQQTKDIAVMEEMMNFDIEDDFDLNPITDESQRQQQESLVQQQVQQPSSTSSTKELTEEEDLKTLLLKKYYKHCAFPMISNKQHIHRLLIQRISELFMNYIQLITIVNPLHYFQGNNNNNYSSLSSSSSSSSPPPFLLTIDNYHFAIIAIIESILRSSKIRCKVRDAVDNLILMKQMNEKYNIIINNNNNSNTNPSESNQNNQNHNHQALELSTDHPIINYFAKHSQNSLKKIYEGFRVYGFIQFCSEYIPLDYFLRQSDFQEMISTIVRKLNETLKQMEAQQPAPMVVDKDDEEKKTNEDDSTTIIDQFKEELNKCDQLQKLLESISFSLHSSSITTTASDSNNAENSMKSMALLHGFTAFYTKIQPTIYNSSISYLQSELKIPFYYHCNFQNVLQSNLQDRLRSLATANLNSIPNNNNDIAYLAIDSTAPIGTDAMGNMITPMDLELDYLRKNIHIKQLRGRGKKQSNYDAFIEAAEKISPDVKEIAKLVYQDPNDLNALNLLHRTIIHHILQSYQQQQQPGGGERGGGKVPFVSLLSSSYLENSLSMKNILLVENESSFGNYLVGNELSLFKKHNEVLEHYCKAFIQNPSQPIIALNISCYLIMLSSHPLMKDRMNLLLKGFAFLLFYQDLRLKQFQQQPTTSSSSSSSSTAPPAATAPPAPTTNASSSVNPPSKGKGRGKGKRGATKSTTQEQEEEQEQAAAAEEEKAKQQQEKEQQEKERQQQSFEEEIRLFQETFYNIGRSFQEIKFIHLATHCYEQCLALADRFEFLRKPNASQSVTWESAYNLVLFYKKSNAKDLALSVMKKYLSFP